MALGEAVGPLLERLVEALQSLGVFVAIVAALFFLGRYLAVPLVERLADGFDVAETPKSTLLKVTGATFVLLGIYLAIPLSGLATTPTTIAAISAGATIAIGFASQDILANLVSGTFLVLDPEFHIGDWIEWQDKEGVIEDISFRVTRVHTFDNELITVPNSELTANAVHNPATKDRRRLTPQVGIGYEDDIGEARTILLDVAEATEAIIDRPAPEVLVADLEPSAVVLEVRFWVADPSRAGLLRIESNYVQAVKERFDDAGIEMPYPYRELTGSVGTWTEHAPEEG